MPELVTLPMAAFLAEHENNLRELRRHFVLPPDSSVATFLTEHRSIPQILLEARNHLSASFGPETVFVLRTAIDEAGPPTLYAVAMWPGTLHDVRDALAKFDDWWIPHSRQASEYLNFTYELV
jgi:hypothetical protein